MYIDPSLRRRTTSSDEALLRSILSENGIKKPCMKCQGERSDFRGNAAEGGESCACACRANTKNGVFDRSLGSVYAPVQCWRQIYDLEKGLSRGTVFEELDLPFGVSQSKGGSCCG